MHFKLITLNSRYTHSCLALFYVRACLEDNIPGARPQMVQYTINDPYYPMLKRIGAGAPDALFFSVYIWNGTYIKRLVNDLIKLLPATPIILGGPQAGALVQSLQPQVLQNCTVVQGEIEGVEKTFYRDLAENRLKRNYSCTKVKTFKSPYRKDDFAGPLQNRQVYYESSRGCPFSCTYCLSAGEKGVRHLPVSQVKAEIKEILRYAPKVIRFVDRTFNDLPERALEIWRFLVEQPGGTLFHFEMAPDRFTEEMFQFLEQVSPGRFQFEIGVQSTNPETLDAINRKCDRAKLAAHTRRLVALNTIHIHLDLILGLPFETVESYARSFTDVFDLEPHYIQMGLLKILPDTPISKRTSEYGMVACGNPPYEILANRWLDREALDELYWFGECVEAFYNNRYFRSFWKCLHKRGEDMFVFFKSLLVLCRGRGFFDLAPTQELLSSLLHEITAEHPDRELLRELLVYDWLRCGHHFLPDHLAGEPLAAQKKKLWKQMDQNWEGVYDYKTRDEFFKQGVFRQFTGHLLRETGLADQDFAGYLCFSPAREDTVFKHNVVLVIPAIINGANV